MRNGRKSSTSIVNDVLQTVGVIISTLIRNKLTSFNFTRIMEQWNFGELKGKM